MAALVLQHRTASEPVVTFRIFVRNLIFYTHVQQDDLETESEVVAFLTGLWQAALDRYTLPAGELANDERCSHVRYAAASVSGPRLNLSSLPPSLPIAARAS